jgi:hypothetical protein
LFAGAVAFLFGFTGFPSLELFAAGFFGSGSTFGAALRRTVSVTGATLLVCDSGFITIFVGPALAFAIGFDSVLFALVEAFGSALGSGLGSGFAVALDAGRRVAGAVGFTTSFSSAFFVFDVFVSSFFAGFVSSFFPGFGLVFPADEAVAAFADRLAAGFSAVVVDSAVVFDCARVSTMVCRLVLV